MEHVADEDAPAKAMERNIALNRFSKEARNYFTVKDALNLQLDSAPLHSPVGLDLRLLKNEIKSSELQAYMQKQISWQIDQLTSNPLARPKRKVVLQSQALLRSEHSSQLSQRKCSPATHHSLENETCQTFQSNKIQSSKLTHPTAPLQSGDRLTEAASTKLASGRGKPSQPIKFGEITLQDAKAPRLARPVTTQNAKVFGRRNASHAAT